MSLQDNHDASAEFEWDPDPWLNPFSYAFPSPSGNFDSYLLDGYGSCLSGPPEAVRGGMNGPDVLDVFSYLHSSVPPTASDYLLPEQLNVTVRGGLEMGPDEDVLQRSPQLPYAEAMTPTATNDTTWTPPGLDPASASPLAASETTQLSPTLSLPHPTTPATPNPPLQFQVNQGLPHATITACGGSGNFALWVEDFQQPSSGPESSTQSQTHSDIHLRNTTRPRTPMRERRRKEKPEKCPFCQKGFPFMADRDKHIVARHPELAYSVGVSVPRFPCRHCPNMKPYKRSDHLRRHERNKHGREKQKRGARPA
ncbi:hypothetical protein B0T25DRAFT_209720 [Lasiosphaeria hispida]|uniref:C2H2-type domain-containing protein n=1 Tax=Lasiosphaeria hispida TaxID=260671 RepID=A0AAJ0HIK8_9PEZI|nr:hypothetical protein B0T25DRAFT_209720 [Lasiosphaeria hispida]